MFAWQIGTEYWIRCQVADGSYANHAGGCFVAVPASLYRALRDRGGLPELDFPGSRLMDDIYISRFARHVGLRIIGLPASYYVISEDTAASWQQVKHQKNAYYRQVISELPIWAAVKLDGTDYIDCQALEEIEGDLVVTAAAPGWLAALDGAVARDGWVVSGEQEVFRVYGVTWTKLPDGRFRLVTRNAMKVGELSGLAEHSYGTNSEQPLHGATERVTMDNEEIGAADSVTVQFVKGTKKREFPAGSENGNLTGTESVPQENADE